MARIGRLALSKAARGFPVGRLLLAGDVAMLAGRHLARLDGSERRRLIRLAGRRAKGADGLTASERVELAVLLAKLEPRLLFGSAVDRLSPVPVPRRLLYGRRGSTARIAAKLRT
jgi:hypothetical protein